MNLKNTSIRQQKYPASARSHFKIHIKCREIEVDGVSDGKYILIGAIAEHIENAGVHSGDATIVIPTRTVKKNALEKSKNTQENRRIPPDQGAVQHTISVEDGIVYVIECNLRASRSMPFVSKTVGINLIEIATDVILGHNLKGNFMPKPKALRDKSSAVLVHENWRRRPAFRNRDGIDRRSACIGLDF